MALAQLDRAGIAGGQRLILALAAVVPNRTNGMNHMPGGQLIRQGDLGSAGLAAMERAAFGEKPGPGGTMDRTVDATPTEQGCVCGVDNGVNAQCREIGDDHFQPRRT